MPQITERVFWVRCPICNGKTRTKVYVDSVMINCPLFCPKCKKITDVDIVNLKLLVRK